MFIAEALLNNRNYNTNNGSVVKMSPICEFCTLVLADSPPL